MALAVVRRIDGIFEIERAISSKPAAERLAMRQDLSARLVADLDAWMRAERAKLSRLNDVAKAMDYRLNRSPSFSRFLSDARICRSNNAAERAIRSLARFGALCTMRGSASKQSALPTGQLRPKIARHRERCKKYQKQVDSARLVFVDETWAKTNMAPLRGWAPVGAASSCQGALWSLENHDLHRCASL